mmetsp:Transcript_24185/g.33284  ORF Transcript_24185/g.33284 Transcript_24185/m.33284 type:complete len:438 (+) Transcript_24185:1-1314(+)
MDGPLRRFSNESKQGSAAEVVCRPSKECPLEGVNQQAQRLVIKIRNSGNSILENQRAAKQTPEHLSDDADMSVEALLNENLKLQGVLDSERESFGGWKEEKRRMLKQICLLKSCNEELENTVMQNISGGSKNCETPESLSAVTSELEALRRHVVDLTVERRHAHDLTMELEGTRYMVAELEHRYASKSQEAEHYKKMAAEYEARQWMQSAPGSPFAQAIAQIEHLSRCLETSELRLKEANGSIASLVCHQPRQAGMECGYIPYSGNDGGIFNDTQASSYKTAGERISMEVPNTPQTSQPGLPTCSPSDSSNTSEQKEESRKDTPASSGAAEGASRLSTAGADELSSESPRLSPSLPSFKEFTKKEAVYEAIAPAFSSILHKKTGSSDNFGQQTVETASIPIKHLFKQAGKLVMIGLGGKSAFSSRHATCSPRSNEMV